ncbi:MAG: response regulator, partial [Burkholderiaceae bacterium]
LPLLELEERPSSAAHPTPNDRDGAGARVLIVEDNADLRAMLAEVLCAEGHEVHECEDGISGLRQALALQPDVALVDIGLPFLDGYDVARGIRAGAPDAPIFLIAITGYGSDSVRKKCEAAGFDRHATKPLDLNVLLDWIRTRKEFSRSAAVTPSG